MTTVAIFVGGRSSRMGHPKGRLLVPGTNKSIVEHLVQQSRIAGMSPLLVGENADYKDLAVDVRRLDDDPTEVGPIGGLNAALKFAGDDHVITVACDMPFVDVAVLQEVALYSMASASALAAFKRGPNAKWESMLALFDAKRCDSVVREQIDGGIRSFQRVFSALNAELRPTSPRIERALADWDTPDDLPKL